ncbi:fibronectin type III domain-containing protein [Confluentibacter sediminis]|uniref:fibronectin type III domain-containing protein n=1 Tax=Confluentibacter sediminis TaxID=2219045 RepID=UPI000DAD7487|nr:fibronectin type III domain-containing protein [Confluentibacter sediminis]
MMKHIIFFFLFSTTVMAQNYHYAIDQTATSREPDTEVPTNPTGLVASNITQNTVNLTWTASTDNMAVTGYRIYNNGMLLVDSTGGIETTFTVTGLTAATNYSLTVRAIDAADNESGDSNIETVTTEAYVATNNMIDEIAYFDAILVPLTAKDSLQYYLDTYKSIRLEPGNYGRINGTPINIGSNQAIYGFPAITEFPDINVLAGSTNVHVENLKIHLFKFLSGAPIKNSVFKSIIDTNISSVGGMLENNLFVNVRCSLNFNMSASGYFRNNRIYRHQAGVTPFLLKGNNATPSYGNVNAWTNYLTPKAYGAVIDNVEDITFIGLDSEGWNFNNGSSSNQLPMFNATNIGSLKITDMGGGNGYCAGCETPPFDIQADNLFMINKQIGNTSSLSVNPPQKFVYSTVRANTNLFMMYDNLFKEVYIKEAGGLNFIAHHNSNQSKYPNYSVFNDDKEVTTTITNTALVTKLTNMIQQTPRTPIARPVHETLPDPLGVNWATERLGKPDSTAYIQNLIDTDNIAELPEGVFYIGSTLKVNVNIFNQQGIIGQGTGKTVICGLTDDFPLISLYNSGTTADLNTFHLANLTLQGGSEGVYAPDATNLLYGCTLKYLIFRNQTNGIRLHWIFGLDNNFLDHLNFIDCVNGINNDNAPVYTINNAGYMDKTFYYKNQFINCGTALEVQSIRGSNLNMWMECNFVGNGLVGNHGSNNFCTYVNCDFTNNKGNTHPVNAADDVLFRGNPISMYNCNFSGNSSTYILGTTGAYIEGCNFLDSTTLTSNYHYETGFYILNSKCNGDLGGGWNFKNASIINSTFALDTDLNKLMTNIKKNVRTVILDAPANPYPQFFVKH